MTIIIPKSLFRGRDRGRLRLLDSRCKAEETNASFSLTTPLTGCDTKRRLTPTAIVYSNIVFEIPVAAKDVATRVREIEIPFSCYLSKFGVVSSVGWRPSNTKLRFSDEGKGNFTLSLNMFREKMFVSPYMTSLLMSCFVNLSSLKCQWHRLTRGCQSWLIDTMPRPLRMIKVL